MFLRRLSEYGERFDDMPPPMYQPVAIRYILRLDADGRLLTPRPLDLATQQERRGRILLAPSLKRSVAVVPKLLADNAEYVLGVARENSKSERVRQQHELFVSLVRECAGATGEVATQAVANFLDTFHASALDLPDDFDPSANVTFEVEIDGQLVRPMDLAAVRSFWASYAAAADVDAEPMQCLVCGEWRPAVERLPISIKGIPDGQSSGMALISANAGAFESYGLTASLIAPTCEECGQRFGNALNQLLAAPATHLTIGPVAYVFWTREEAPFSLATLLDDPKPEEVQQFLGAAWKGRPDAARIATAPYYAAALSASGARVVVREWIETTLGVAQANLERYFRLMGLRDYDGSLRHFPLRQLARATINANSRKEEPAPLVAQSLLHAALYGEQLPLWILFQTVRRTRAEQRVTGAHAALIKMVWLSNPGEEGGDHDMAELDLTNRAPAYLCGRLLAELEAVQRAALGDVNATIVDRYFGTASSAPASVFGRLVRGAQPHLAKLRREREGTYIALDRRLQEILEGLPKFPHTLKLQEQGLFALGFYHQKAADARAARERKAGNNGVSAVTTDLPPAL